MMPPTVKPIDAELAILFADLDACLSLAQSMDRPYLTYLIEMAVMTTALELTNARPEDATLVALSADARRKVRTALSDGSTQRLPLS